VGDDVDADSEEVLLRCAFQLAPAWKVDYYPPLAWARTTTTRLRPQGGAMASVAVPMPGLPPAAAPAYTQAMPRFVPTPVHVRGAWLGLIGCPNSPLSAWVCLSFRCPSPRTQTPPTNNNSTEEELVPPANFALVCKGVYRSGFPKKRNFPFLRKLGIKSVLYGCARRRARHV